MSETRQRLSALSAFKIVNNLASALFDVEETTPRRRTSKMKARTNHDRQLQSQLREASSDDSGRSEDGGPWVDTDFDVDIDGCDPVGGC